ncbi:transcription-repair coupling factor [Lacticaseibacillus nasuensis]|uniref:transcription-repair coupling factor n=1 Tax=Lacticaseibacillus nasuensis TaxID=944671 RepID=UPI002247A143|nr:transcription-repair coupling factor [Lacticaseibacillus nasuensis]MCX2456433.1 transcription-repair coupling factor [Lacticaseibacillus nasuensis]
MDLIGWLGQVPALQTLWPQLGAGRHMVTGLSGSAKTLMLASALEASDRQLIVVENNRFHASELATDLTSLLGADLVWPFPVEDVLAAEVAVSSPDSRNERINALDWLQTGHPGILVTSLAGLKRLLPPPDAWQQATLTLSMNSDIDPQRLATQLVAMGYSRDTLVGTPGQFAIRGGIIDIYPLNQDNPVRIELFDTEVDSLRSFDMGTQRSIANLESVVIPPATDLIADHARLVATGERLAHAATAAKAKAKTKEAKQGITNGALAAAALLQSGERPEQLGAYADVLYPEGTRLVDYVQPAALFVFDEYARILDSDVTLLQDTLDWATGLQTSGMRVGEWPNPAIQDLVHHSKHPQLYLNLFQKGMGNLRLDSLTNVASRDVQQFFSQMPLLKTETDRWRKQHQTVVFLVQTKARAEKLSETLRDFEIDSVISEPEEILPNTVQVVVGTLQNGFELPDSKLVVVTEHELYNQQPKRHARHQTLANAERLRSYTELTPGDYVVHVNHGIGQYVGMQTLEVDGVHQDYITILYQKGDKLFIPVSQLHLVQKYVASEGKKPKINKLGGAEWQKTKRRVAAKIEDIADDLIKLYAAREAEPGFAFAPDDDLQRAFEAEFPYPETPDQLRSVKEIKRDMEKPRPMDRLLVGDVGFGKTEVALRAAFKAVENNKQVAILVPTTILAQQHFDTMSDRFADFPVSIGMLSRFRTKAQIKETITGLKNGSVDIVVGTHRLLSKDIQFKQLGLLVIDEEQRFGVKHKERIKALRQNVDVLTLTATPIPRTLNMSMLGVRDLSVIETPPTNRYPIQTFVMEQNAGVLREAIERELERGGQVFYLHNRVADIERTVDQLQQLVPSATIAYAHGQMTETQLENVIYDFIHGAYDVLVTTTIIETGVDMPNVNTLIIEDADHYGLSQLYQLRGRIGRSSRVAFAYFMYQPNRVLTSEAEKRLQAIKDFTELGSGFKIAMRDLAIRGAGNLLGSQQHGFIDSVGYDLYTQMLGDAVAEKRGKTKAAPTTDTEVELDIEAYLPDSYVSDSRQKIELYKRMREITNQAQEDELVADLIDRFGDYPPAVANLLAVTHLKRFADRGQVVKIRRDQQQLFIDLTPAASAKLQGTPVFEVLQHTTLKARVGMPEQTMRITLTVPAAMTTADWLHELSEVLEALATVVAP